MQHSRLLLLAHHFSAALLIAITCASCGSRTPGAPSTLRDQQVLTVSDSTSGTLTVPWSCVTGTAGAFASACHADSASILAARVRAAAVAPGAPGNLRATVTGTTVTLDWDAPTTGDPVTTYEVHASSAPGLSNLGIFAVGNRLSLVATDVPPGTYYVRVRAGNSAGGGGFSNEIIVVVSSSPTACPGLPGAPTSLVSTVNGSTVTLTWNTPSGNCPATTFQIEAGATPGASNLANLSTGNTNASFVAPNVPAGTYYVRVRAGNSRGLGGPSNEVVIVVTGTAAPSPGSLTGIWVLETALGNPAGTFGSTSGTREITVLTQSGSTISGTNYLTGNNWNSTGSPSVANCTVGACITRTVNGTVSGATVSWKRTATPNDPGHVGCDERHDLTLSAAGTLLFGTTIKLADCNTSTPGDTPKVEAWELR